MTSNQTDTASDSHSSGAYAARVWQYKQAETVAAMIFVGRELGLFKALAGVGPQTAAQVAVTTGLDERWVLEWLRLQTAAKILSYVDEDNFELPEIGAAMFADGDSPQFMIENFEGGVSANAFEQLMASFKTGIGKTFEDDGPHHVHHAEARHLRSARNQVVPNMIPALEGVHEKLEVGCLVADIGCGDGALVRALAERYPNSRFHAYEPNVHAVAYVKEVAAASSLANVDVIHADGESLLADTVYDLVITFDCIHDMTYPDRVMAKIREHIAGDGTWFIKDIRTKPTLKENLRNPMLAMMYGFSLLSCMASALSEKGGAGLGTLGFNPEIAERMTTSAGFTRFQMHDFGDPGNLYYEVRP